MSQEIYMFGKKHKEVSLDKNLEFIISREFVEFKIPIGLAKDELSPKFDLWRSFKDVEKGEPSLASFAVTQKTSPLTPRDFNVKEIISDLKRIIEDVKGNFEDIRGRQIFFFKFKEKINDLWDTSSGDMKKTALRLEYAIKNLKSEKLNIKQIDALTEAIEILERSGGKGKAEIKKILLDAGIYTLPKIEGLAELYAEEC